MHRTRGVLVAAVCVVAVAATSAQSSQAQPFQELWNAVANLATRVTVLETASTQPPNQSALRVVNGVGATIGFFAPPDKLLYFDGGTWFSVDAVSMAGFGGGTGLQLLYDLPDCAGPAYMSERHGAPLARTMIIADGMGNYAADPLVERVPQSVRGGINGPCGRPSPVARFMGPHALFDLSVFGPPPFRIE